MTIASKFSLAISESVLVCRFFVVSPTQSHDGNSVTIRDIVTHIALVMPRECAMFFLFIYYYYYYHYYFLILNKRSQFGSVLMHAKSNAKKCFLSKPNSRPFSRAGAVSAPLSRLSDCHSTTG